MNTLLKVQHLDHSFRMATRASLTYNHASSRSLTLKEPVFQRNGSHFTRYLFLTITVTVCILSLQCRVKITSC